MARKKISYKAGDIFAIPVAGGQYVFGRILLDVTNQCLNTGLAERDGGLFHFENLLVEGFNLLKDTPEFETAPAVIKGYTVDDSAITDGTFKIVGHQPVDPREIDFPECFDVHPFNGDVHFLKGEIKLPLAIDEEQAESYGVNSGMHFSEAFGMVILTLMGRTDLVEVEANLQHDDVRFNPPAKRKEIYELIGVDLSAASYYDLALKHGFDTARFFTGAPVQEKPEDESSGGLLGGILWAFDGEKFSSQAKFEKALAEYAKAIGTDLATGEKIHLGAIAILVEYVDEEDEDHELEFVLKPDNGTYFTDTELLYKINQKVTKPLAELDKHFFEGLSLLKNNTPPLYSLNLGS